MTPSGEAAVGQMHSRVEFTLNGSRLALTRDEVDSRLADVVPGPIRTHGVRINNTWYPVRQAFGLATGLSGLDFTSHTARRHLAALGYELHGEIDHRSDPPGAPVGVRPPGDDRPGATVGLLVDESWHTEANVQGAVVTWLASQGWRVLRVADTATKEHGIDVEAVAGDQRVGIEVKGYPSRLYADPARAGEAKRTQPSTQAGHWYAQAVLAAMRLRGRRPETRSVIALPDFPRYRQLFSETASSLVAARIELWWVSRDGEVEMATDDPDATGK